MQISPFLQELTVVLIVGWVAWRTLIRPITIRAAHPLSQWLLSRGRVKWAMRVRQFALNGAKR
jgi:hypothetical protein